MSIKQVKTLVRSQADGHYADTKHGITLSQALVEPQPITVIVRIVRDGKISDKHERAWLVGREPGPDGYQIVMQAEGHHFGLASLGFASDPHPVLVGWYGDLVTTFMAM